MLLRCAAATLIALALAAPVRAELVFFANGNSMSVKGHQVDGDTLVLSLRSGGEIRCDPAVITRITPDEVPYPEPEPDSAVARVTDAPRPQADSASAAMGILAAVPYGDVIDAQAAKQGVSAKLVRAVISVESAGQATAISPRGAMGLMQLMPATARQYQVKNPYDARANIEAGVKHLRALLDQFPLTLALAAYNAGEAAVRRFGGIPPYPETERYVSRILQLLGR